MSRQAAVEHRGPPGAGEEVGVNAPSQDDRYIKVRAWITDEQFGYDHWRAAQFMAPDGSRPAVLVLCENEQEQAAILAALRECQP